MRTNLRSCVYSYMHYTRLSCLHIYMLTYRYVHIHAHTNTNTCNAIY